MDFLFLSKQNWAVALFLLLVIIISESHILNFFFNNSLGRAIFILFILVIAYLNKILGIISVLFAVLLISKKETNWFEGFTDKTTTSTDSSSSDSTTPVTTTSPSPVTTTSPSPVTTTSPSPTSTTDSLDPSGNSNSSLLSNINLDIEKEIEKVKQTLDPSGNQAIEGFDILGTENNLKRGKKSNSIPVSNQARKSEYVDPYYHSSFGNSFSFF